MAEAAFTAIGLKPNAIKSTLANETLSKNLMACIAEAELPDGKCEAKMGNLLYAVASKIKTATCVILEHRPALCKLIASGGIASNAQAEEACRYFNKSAKYDVKEFEAQCGVGVVLTDDDINATIAEILTEHKAVLDEQRYRVVPRLIGVCNQKLRWADGRQRKALWDAAVLAALGPKDERDAVVRKGGDKSKDKKGGDANKADKKKAAQSPADLLGLPVSVSEDELDQGRAIPAARNSEDQSRRHAEWMAANGNHPVLTRFPPEPNGFLHLGHAKAMNFSFGVGIKKGGATYLRFDDTNPEAEKKVYIDNIIENVKWLGNTPWKITYSSDYFHELHALAIKLIKAGKAYVCHQTGEEIKKCRETHSDSPYRSRSVEENLELFENMRLGKYAQGHCSLRMKGDMKHANPQMWDMIAYRILYKAHPHVGDEWCIYPTYDYTHCIVDSLEHITHSLCTLEFEVRRESYFGLLDDLDLYKPKVWEYSRLNVTYGVMSKRRLLQLVDQKHVAGWDDPRLLTLNGLRRRGIRAAAINTFCEAVGVTRNANMIPMTLLEHFVRENLADVQRCFIVADPLKVTLTNVAADAAPRTFDAPNHPKDAERGTRSLALTRVVYIDRADFRDETDAKALKGYYGLAPGREVLLRYATNITCTKVIRCPSTGRVLELEATLAEAPKKVKGIVHWVSEPKAGVDPCRVELRQYGYLFKSENPMAQPDFLGDIDPNSLIVQHGFCEPLLAGRVYARNERGDSADECHVQAERLAYYVVDPDSTSTTLVLNKTVGLKSGYKK